MIFLESIPQASSNAKGIIFLAQWVVIGSHGTSHYFHVWFE